MSSGVANSKAFESRRALLTLALAALVLRALEPPERPAVKLAALLGEFRTVVAGACWLRANLAWERHDQPAMLTWIRLTVLADERPAYFWINGARMLAYDVPTWGPESAPVAVQDKIRREQALAALSLLEDSRQRHGSDPEIVLEAATIRWRCLGDREGAARGYREAAELPGAPYYAGRIHAELLCQLGRPAEALAWLRSLLPRLPPGDAAARREVVAARIRALEAEVTSR